MLTSMTQDELFPQMPSFTLKNTGKSYVFRKINLKDQARIHRAGNISDIFRTQNWPVFFQLVYAQLCEDDKRQFLASHENRISDEGEESKVWISGPDKLFETVDGMAELKIITEAFNQLMILSYPPEVQKKIDEEIKKKELEINHPTGEKSLTESPTPMATPLTSSENTPQEKSA